MSGLTNLDLVNQCDILPYSPVAARAAYYTLTWHGTPIGYVLERVVEQLTNLPPALQEQVQVTVDASQRRLSVFEDLPTEPARSAAAAALCADWRARHVFRVLAGWRAELYPVYGPGTERLWSVERSASAIFGIVTYGVHLTAYTRDAQAPHGLRIWVPRRAARKPTFPGMLDNTVAGGMATGEIPLECLLREAREEAGLDAELVRARATACGTVSYVYIQDARAGGEIGLVQPECQFVYDLELPGDVVPTPNDDEVAEFYLWTLDEVQAAMARGEFKPNCALVILDFLIRWGILCEENEEDYVEIKRRIHRVLEFPGPHEAPEYRASRTVTSAGPEF